MVRTRTVSAALYNMAVQLSAISYSNIYRADDRPEYRRGNRVLARVCVMNIILYIVVKAWYTWRNRRRDKVWDAMIPEEKDRYLETTTDKGSKRLSFRFVS